jgi:hypothetical protein
MKCLTGLYDTLSAASPVRYGDASILLEQKTSENPYETTLHSNQVLVQTSDKNSSRAHQSSRNFEEMSCKKNE